MGNFVTIYILYKKEDQMIYAFSLDKKFINEFLQQRNRKCFHLEKKKMQNSIIGAFLSKYREYQLIDIPLFHNEEVISIIGTIHEDNILSDSSERIWMEMEAIEKALSQYPFKKKYLNLIKEITNIVNNQDKEEPIIEIDTFSLFCYLFKDTF